MLQSMKDRINKKAKLSDLTNRELKALVNELKNCTFEDDSPVRKFVEIKEPAYFMTGLMLLTSQLCQILSDRLDVEEDIDIEKSECFISQNAFNDVFKKILEGSKKRYLDPVTCEISKDKTSRIEVVDNEGNWLIDYNTSENRPHFWYQYDRVYTVLKKYFLLEHDELQLLMLNLVETEYKMKGVQPESNEDGVYEY